MSARGGCGAGHISFPGMEKLAISIMANISKLPRSWEWHHRDGSRDWRIAKTPFPGMVGDDRLREISMREIAKHNNHALSRENYRSSFPIFPLQLDADFD